MTTRQDLENQLRQLAAEIEQITQQLKNLQQQEDQLFRQRQAELDSPNTPQSQAKLAALDDRLSTVGRAISQQVQIIASLESQRNTISKALSAGQPVGNNSPADSAGARPESVIQAGGSIDPKTAPVTTNAQPTPTVSNGAVTFGTNGRVVTAANSQAPAGNTIVNQGSVKTANEDQTSAPVPSGDQTGAAAGNDDSTRNLVQQRVDSLFSQNQVVLPQDNVLDNFASYTYNISVYLMSPDMYQSFITDRRGYFENDTLLFQSGGAPPRTGPYNPYQSQDASVRIRFQEAPTRNPYFSQDFFIDNVELKNVIVGKGQGSAHNSTLLNFTVTEYNGITLLQNLDRAVVDYIYKGDPKLKSALDRNTELGTWGSQIYLMVIRFYGYDDNGKLVTGGTNNPNATTDPQAVVEKYIPFVVRNVTFKVGSRAVQYFWDCATPGTMVNTGPTSATVPYNCQLSGKSLRDALSGDLVTVYQPATQREPPAATRQNTAPVTPTVNLPPVRVNPTSNSAPLTRNSAYGIGVQQTLDRTAPAATPPMAKTPETVPTTAPPKADAAKPLTETVTQGLMAAMNGYQQQMFSLGQIEIPNKYSIEFSSNIIADAQLTYRGRADRDLTPTASGTNPRNLLTSTQAAELDKKIFSITAGQQLVQVIEMLVRNSTYISDQQLVIVDPVTGVQVSNPGRTKNLAWFKINMVASPIGYDFIRKDYAWDIKYVVSEYRIVAPETGYFPVVDFPGFHKRYPYWFTGENKSIINFEQNYNYQYHRVLSGGILSDSTSANYLDFTKTVFYPRSGQSTQGGPLRTNEAAANLADYFYSPGDQKTVELEIIGDPAWIFQGEASGQSGILLSSGQPFLADGTINVDYGQVFFEVSWNSPEDYDVDGNGLINPSKNYTQTAVAQGKAGTPRQSYAYGARTCTSYFRAGRFTQMLDGYLVSQNLNTQINQDNQRAAAAGSDQALFRRVAADVEREINARSDRQLIAKLTRPLNNKDNSQATAIRDSDYRDLSEVNNDTRTDQLIARDP